MADDDLLVSVSHPPGVNESSLIQLVKDRPVWDLTEENYRKKESLEKAWHEVLTSLYCDFPKYDSDCQALLTKDVKKKWTNLRDSYNKSRKAGKESTLKYKALDFLSKTYDEKEKRGSLCTHPSKGVVSIITSPPVVDPADADTQLNSSLQGFQSRFNPINIQARRESVPFKDTVSEDSQNVTEEESGYTQNNTNDTSQEDCKENVIAVLQPPCSTTSNADEPALHSRRGIKRPLEENDQQDGERHFLQYIKSLTKNFTDSQNQSLKLQIMELINSVCNSLEETELLELLLSTKKYGESITQKCDIAEKIIHCVKNADKV